MTNPHCTVPYECDFRGHCWEHVPEYSVFDIAELKAASKWDLYEKGILELRDIPADYPLGTRQRQQVVAELEGTVTIHRYAIRRFLEGLNYPLYFLDFESFQAAVPPFTTAILISRSYSSIRCISWILRERK